jgi:hypothetical protein
MTGELKMSLKSMTIVTAAALATIAGGASAASAHGHQGHHGHHFFNHHHHHGLRIIVGSGYSSCGYLYRRWSYTGSHYWKSRYLACKYGW